ncbi:MAG: class I SAM-dependent methyltransferase [Patescibacteria group bacterium]
MLPTPSPPASASCILCGDGGIPRAVRGMTLYRCGSCGFQWASPVLSSSHYDTCTVDLSEAKHRRRRRNGEDRIRLLRKLIPPGKARGLRSLDHACDIGCGEGMVLQCLREAGFEGGFGIEPNPAFVAFARSLGLSVEQGTLETAAPLLRERQPHVVILIHVIEHLNDPLAALRTLRSAMLPGSFLVLETPNLEGYSGRVLGDDWPLVYEEHLSYFTPATLRRCLEQAGFSIRAEGKCDFDQYHMGIGDLLFRLGLRKQKRRDRAPPPPSPSGSGGQQKVPSPSAARRMVASLASAILSRAVVALGRVDYLWMVAFIGKDTASPRAQTSPVAGGI